MTTPTMDQVKMCNSKIKAKKLAATTARFTWAGECGRPTSNIVRKVNSKFAGIRNAQIAMQ